MQRAREYLGLCPAPLCTSMGSTTSRVDSIEGHSDPLVSLGSFGKNSSPRDGIAGEPDEVGHHKAIVLDVRANRLVDREDTNVPMCGVTSEMTCSANPLPSSGGVGIDEPQQHPISIGKGKPPGC